MQPETQQRIATLRQKAVEGTLTLDEMREAVKMMRGDRASSVKASADSRRAKVKAAIPDADTMLDELGIKE